MRTGQNGAAENAHPSFRLDPPILLGMAIRSADEFVRLRTSDVEQEYWRAAHEEARIEVWFDVVARYPQMRTWVAHNKTVPIEILIQLATDPDPAVRSAVADKRKLTIDLFRLLAADHDESVGARIAYNRKVPTDVLEQLASDPAKIVREAVHHARSRQAPGR